MRVRQVFAHYDRTNAPTGQFRYCPLCQTALVPVESGRRQRPTCPGCGFVQYRNPAPAVSVLVVDDERIVLGRRRGEPGKGRWALPSGYVEFEEDFVTTAVQEAKEETGLDITVRAVINVVSSFVSPRFHFLGIYVVADVVGGSLRAGDDLADVAWFPLGGPMPALGFEEDACAIGVYKNGLTGLPIDLER